RGAGRVAERNGSGFEGVHQESGEWKARQRKERPLGNTRLPEAPAVHQPTVKIEPPYGFGILERVVGPQLPSRCQPGNKAGFLTVDQRVRSAVPCLAA